MTWEENSCICLHMQLIAFLYRIGVIFTNYFLDNTCSSLLIFREINKYPQKNMRNDSMFCWGLNPNRTLGFAWYFHQNLVITSTTILSRSEGRATPLLR